MPLENAASAISVNQNFTRAPLVGVGHIYADATLPPGFQHVKVSRDDTQRVPCCEPRGGLREFRIERWPTH
jgi:hypothetical protein